MQIHTESAMSFAKIMAMRDAFLIYSKLLMLVCRIPVIVSLLLSQPLKAVEKIDLKIGPESLSQIKTLDQEVGSLERPHFFNFNWDARDAQVQILRGSDLDAFSLKKAAKSTRVYSWGQCQDLGIFLISYPQYLKKEEIAFHFQFEALIRKQGHIQARIPIPPLNEFKDNSRIYFSNNCQQAFLAIGDELYRFQMTERPSIEKLPFRIFTGSKVFQLQDGRLLFERVIDKLSSIVLVSLSNSPAEQILDQSTRGVELNYYDKGYVCWFFDKYSKQTRKLKCWNELSGTQTVYGQEEVGPGDWYPLNFANTEFSILQSENSHTISALVHTPSSEIVFQSKHPFFWLRDGWLAVLEKSGIGDHALKFFNYKEKKWKNFSYDFLSSGEVVQHKLSNGTIQVATRNSYGQLSFFAFNEQGLITPPFRFPNFNPTTQTQLVSLKAKDGFDHFGYLVTPTRKTSDVKAAIVYVHGGGCHVKIVPSQSIMIEAESVTIAQQNIPVLSITYRNDFLPGREETVRTRTKENCGVEELNDIESGASYLRSLYPEADLYLWGRSHGGYLANVMATQDSRANLFKGIISEVGVWTVDFGTEFVHDAKEHYSPERAPILHVDQLKTPLLMFHGKQDINANYHTQAEPLLKKMVLHSGSEKSLFLEYRHPTKPITAWVSPTEAHAITRYSTHLHWTEAIRRFIADHSKKH